jgi:acetylornithine deacetylase
MSSRITAGISMQSARNEAFDRPMRIMTKKSPYDVLPELLERRIPFFRSLVQVPSTRGNEEKAQMMIRAELENLGLHVETLRVRTAKRKIRPRTGPVIVGILKGRGGGRSLILNSHIDCAPTGPLKLWDRSPFSGTVENGFIHGRGSWDDKAGSIAILLVLDLLRHNGIRLKGDLIIHSVVEDEFSGLGTESLMKPEFRGDAAIIVDGHYDTRLAIGHPGHMQFKIRLYGTPAPSCRADAGDSAIEKSFLLIKGIQQWSRKIHESIDSHWTRACEGSLLNIGKIHGGEWVGAVPAHCIVEGLMRFAPPFTLKAMKSALRKKVRRMATENSWGDEIQPEVEFGDLCFEPLELGTDHPFFSLMGNEIEKVIKKAAEPYICPGWCDLRHLHHYYSIPACLFGPGKGQGAHRQNECFEIQSLLPHVKVLTGVTRGWCETAE